VTAPRILYVIGSLELGGTESQMVLLIRQLKQRGYRCELFALEAKGPFMEILQRDGIIIHDGGCKAKAHKALKVFLLLRAQLRLWRLALRMQPDVLHAYLPLANFMGALAGRAARVKKIITSRRALGAYQDRRPYLKPLYRIANALSDKVTVNSEAVRQDVISRDGIAPWKLVPIRNGLDLGRFAQSAGDRATVRSSLGLGSDEIGIIKVGNLIPYKGHADLLAAFKKVVDQTSGVKLFLVGEDRGIQADLERLAAGLGVPDRVHFLGRRNDVPSLLMAMDLYVMASHEEGSSNALLEAMAAGLPIVATDAGGNRESLGDGLAGMLVPAHDAQAMARAIDALLADAGARARLAANAIARARQYGIPETIDAHIALYSDN
jgi:glycosyltransferase involved in cell wall biosynthesis